MSISGRLREERKRLKLTQQEAATAGAISFTAFQGYERGDRVPNGESLALWASCGFDVLYILTGSRSSSDLSAEQNVVLSTYGQLSEELRPLAVAILQTMVNSQS